jgi:hypothetical protein
VGRCVRHRLREPHPGFQGSTDCKRLGFNARAHGEEYIEQENREALLDAMLAVATRSVDNGGGVDGNVLGVYLRDQKGKIVDGCRFENERKKGGRSMAWYVEKV